MDKIASRDISITGIVQGVGFRPHVYNLARKLGLHGTVRNSGSGVHIQVEGTEHRLDEFITSLRESPPVLARIGNMVVTAAPVRNFTGFNIAITEGHATGESVVPPDTALCPGCRGDLTNPRSRHYQYPFTNCTCCGPRFTIVESLPYDRPNTSMNVFAMCPDCEGEYRNPSDRRFHAQPVACPGCGPKVWLADVEGRVIEGDWLTNTWLLLSKGEIIALKSPGGFHLACDAANTRAVKELRRRKGRPFKPLAVMCRDLDVVRQHCCLSPAEEAKLCSPAAPVLLLVKRIDSPLPEELAPNLKTVGVMLPYTPLHHLLLAAGPPVLVMTSGNRSGLPLAKSNNQALAELGGIAGYFLLHDREIINRCDDSVVRLTPGATQYLRRSRGYVPAPVTVPAPTGGQDSVFLGAGGEMKNTFCLLKGNLAYPGQHTGRLNTRQGLENYRECLENYTRLLRASPTTAGYDPHPGYNVSRLVRDLASNCTPVWHHHAHLASCMAENQLEGEVTGIILDGTGYGRDGNIWGFEILHGNYLDFTREFHLEYMPLPGGERAVQSPWITAVAWLAARLGESGLALATKIFPGRETEVDLLGKMVSRGINSPLASSCGRLFDAAAALLGICLENTYDGQAATELGELAPAEFNLVGDTYPWEPAGDVIRTGAMLAALMDDLKGCCPKPLIARKFHDTVIDMVVTAARRVRETRGASRVVLSGGSWHNLYLLQGVLAVLEDNGFEVYQHRLVPPGDGGLALGQAVVAMWRHQLNFS
ncbi:MAG: carbamoyltransferase HypF [Bacillota bacterium]